MKTAWTALGMIGLMVVAAAGCEVTVESDDDAIEEGGAPSSGGKGSGGASTSGGKSSGGASTSGGTTTSGGSSSSGGQSGGSAGAPDDFECKTDVDREGTPAESCGFQDADLADKRDGDCFKCLQETADCCDLVTQCYATPSNACRYGSDDRTEFLCFQDCLYQRSEAEGFYTDDDEFDCADECATCGGLVADVSQQLIKCMHDNCEAECFDPNED